MYAIAFDLDLEATIARHPRGVRRAYKDIEAVLAGHGFHRVQQSVFLLETGDLGVVLNAAADLKRLPWFPPCVRDIRGFRVEDWSDFTPFMKRD